MFCPDYIIDPRIEKSRLGLGSETWVIRKRELK
jgi:hypothetical protein